MGVLKHHGFSPVTVFDIGVGYGTFPLYRAFPDAFYHLIDPAHESLAHMSALHADARSPFRGAGRSRRHGDAGGRADIQESPCSRSRPRRVRRPTVCRCAARCAVRPHLRPSLCKIDVQGAEQMVLAGMTGRLDEIDALVIETSTIATVQGGAEIGAIVRFLTEHGFALTDIVGLRRRPLDGATAQLDLLFVPNKAPPRSDRRWAASA